MQRLDHIDAQCSACLGADPPNPRLIEENLRAYVVLLSAHFQGFCRDLYSEASQFIVSKVRPSLQHLIQEQFDTRRALDHGNPNLTNLGNDFQRLGQAGFHLGTELNQDPANALRLQHLAELNRWRNISAHGIPAPANLSLSLALVRSWRASCDFLTLSLDQILYNQLRRSLRRRPWPP